MRRLAIAFALFVFAGSLLGANGSCDYYASPSGAVDGKTKLTPFQIASFWPLAAGGGKTLCLLDGIYTSNTSMILPPAGLAGTDWTRPIWIRALNEGKALIDGQATRQPVLLPNGNNYWILEGFNAARSGSRSDGPVEIKNSYHVQVRRVAAWDAVDANTEIFGSHNSVAGYSGPSTDITFEDTAAWGVARKTYQFSQGGNGVTMRRTWGRWERSTVSGPKMTYTLAYNNYDTTCENCLGQWSGERMPQTYVLLNYDGTPNLNRTGSACPSPWGRVNADTSCTFSSYSVWSAYGIFAADGIDPTFARQRATARWFGSLAYVLPTDRFAPRFGYFVSQLSGVHLYNAVAYVAPGQTSQPGGAGIYTFGLHTNNASTASDLSASGLISIGGAGPLVQETSVGWHSGTKAAVQLGGDAYKDLCYQYENARLSKMPLWPWPMNQRILDATASSGHTPIDITRTIETILGPIPAACDLRKFSGAQASIARGASLPLAAPAAATWESYDPSVIVVAPAADGVTATAAARGKIGASIVAATTARGVTKFLVYVSDIPAPPTATPTVTSTPTPTAMPTLTPTATPTPAATAKPTATAVSLARALRSAGVHHLRPRRFAVGQRSTDLRGWCCLRIAIHALTNAHPTKQQI